MTGTASVGTATAPEEVATPARIAAVAVASVLLVFPPMALGVWEYASRQMLMLGDAWTAAGDLLTSLLSAAIVVTLLVVCLVDRRAAAAWWVPAVATAAWGVRMMLQSATGPDERAVAAVQLVLGAVYVLLAAVLWVIRPSPSSHWPEPVTWSPAARIAFGLAAVMPAGFVVSNVAAAVTGGGDAIHASTRLLGAASGVLWSLPPVALALAMLLGPSRYVRVWWAMPSWHLVTALGLGLFWFGTLRFSAGRPTSIAVWGVVELLIAWTLYVARPRPLAEAFEATPAPVP